MKRIIKKFRIDKRIRVGYGSAFLILLISYLITLYINRQVLEQSRLIGHTNKVIHNLEDFLSLMKDAELGFRGFIISKDKSFLTPYHQSKVKAGPLFYDLLTQIINSKTQRDMMQEAKKLMDRKYDFLNNAIVQFTENDYRLTDSILYYEKEGKANMDSLRTIIKIMQDSERDILDNRNDDLQSRNHLLNTVVIVSLIVALLLFVFGFITYVTENRARRLADRRAETYREELEERVKQLDKANRELLEMRRMEKFTATGRIARTIAHEVRNPLTNINLSVDQLRTETDSDRQERNVFYDMITRNSHRINMLITELLNSTKFIELTAEAVSVNDLLDEALQLAEDRLTLNDIKIIKNYDRDICNITVDKEKIKIAFLNIIVNAIEAMEPGKGILTILTYGEHDKCIIEIEDNGSGMDSETLNKLFEPYYSKKAKGTGLGLTNTENIILSHKGNINVDSEPGKGTRFIISFNFA
ncbi:CHASE3 domain-containing protein [Agriterribacter sp.]|uniref:ATP-binding protein n=1 Tax=Agriterribacter sp. TaxID=2821509 RepID=UPI002CE683B5|nr:CHASE3 domain-containing protein [Agriterribacter sp.]HRO47736.1 CHASE3 domain-containing protein [Agriterribacter sp.]HRQ17201.1 CHASE3 domain-containing protein [Agriterribacter sp.]